MTLVTDDIGNLMMYEDEPVKKRRRRNPTFICICPTCKWSSLEWNIFVQHVLQCRREARRRGEAKEAACHIGSDGGCVRINDCGISLTIPRGALSETILITIEKLCSHSAIFRDRENDDVRVDDAPLLYTEPCNYSLLKPAIVRIPVPNSTPSAFVAYCRSQQNDDFWMEGRAFCFAIHHL